MRSADLHAIFLDFETAPKNNSASLDAVMDMVRCAYELSSTGDLAMALETSRTLDPGVKKFLPEAIGKLGRYFSVSRNLVSAARSGRYRIFEQVSIETCKTTPSPSLALAPECAPSLTEALQPVMRPGPCDDQHTLKRMVERSSKKPFSVVQANFLRRLTSKVNPTWKVHAEIQLLLFYELHPEKQRPRVICSSKSACYLCDLFVKLHGQFHMPRTHGRLYDRWTIPDWATGHQDLKIVVERFNGALEDKIKSTLRERRTLCNHPNESILVAPGHWSSSALASSVPNVASATDNANHLINDPVSAALGSIPGSPSSISMGRALPAESGRPSSSSNRGSGLSFHTYRSTLKPDRVFEDAPSSALHVETTSEPIISPHLYEWARQGERVWRMISDTSRAFRVATDTIHLTLCVESLSWLGLHNACGPERGCWVQVHWLTADERSRIGDDSRNVVRIDELTEGSEVTTECGAAITSDALYVCSGQDIVFVKYEVNGLPTVAHD